MPSSHSLWKPVTGPTSRPNLNSLVEDVPLAATTDQVCKHEPDLFLSGDRFLHYLRHNFDVFDIATYSYSDGGRSLAIDRLITGLRLGRLSSLRYKYHKLVVNNHTKIFICYKVKKIKHRPKQRIVEAVYIGSQNLTHGTNINIMYKVKPEHNKALIGLFDQMWRGQ